MSELNGQVLGLLLVVAVFAAMVPAMVALFKNVTEQVSGEIGEVVGGIDYSGKETRAYITSDLLSF